MNKHHTETILIGDSWIDCGPRNNKFSPSDGHFSYTFSETPPALIADAVASSVFAQQSWKETPIDERIAFFRSLYDAVRHRKDYLASCITKDICKPLFEASGEVDEVLDVITFFANSNLGFLGGAHIPLHNSPWTDKSVFRAIEPRGVYAVIKPWNYPFSLPLWSIVPILLAGNSIVFKPSEYSTLTGRAIGELFQAAHFPPGVLNIVSGTAQVGRILIDDPRIKAISFTGSQGAGKDIARLASPRFLKLELEMGGKDPSIVTRTADPTVAVPGIVWGAFTNAGQVCTGIKRLLIDDSVYTTFIEQIVDATKRLVLGVDIGPLISQSQFAKVSLHVSDALEKGGKLLYGNQHITTRPSDGYYFSPTIIEDMPLDSKIWTEETFGPTLAVRRFETIEDALALANGSQYGLGASVWCGSKKEGLELASQLQAGMVWINDVNFPLPQARWAGIKGSGLGFNLSLDSVMEATCFKEIHYDASTTPRQWWFPYR